MPSSILHPLSPATELFLQMLVVALVYAVAAWRFVLIPLRRSSRRLRAVPPLDEATRVRSMRSTSTTRPERHLSLVRSQS